MGREKRLGLVLLATVLVAHSCASPVAEPSPPKQRQDGYVESGRCKDNSICTYTFAVDQQFFHGDLLQNLTLSAVVRVDCYSVGTFHGHPATEYCMSVTNVAISGSLFNDEATRNKGQKAMMADLFRGQFCFVQTEDGRVVEVYHDEDSHPEGLNLKKTIAAAFQANFRNQEEDEEQDPQSLHVTHYRFEDTDNEDQVKMHRSVSSDDVKEYSTGARVRDVQLQKEEDVEYRSGHLHHSSGMTSVKLSRPRQRITGRRVALPEGPLNDKLLSANSSFSLDLMYCQKIPSSTRGKRDARKPMTRDSLKAVVSKGSAAKAEMEDLRRAMPSIPKALTDLRADPTNNKLSDLLERLLVLEYEYGPLPGYTPALSDVILFLDAMPDDSVEPEHRAIKNLMYSLLSAEGSYRAQKMLIQAIGDATSEAERANIIAFVAFIRGAHPGLLGELEQQMNEADDYLDPLLLAYAALASETTIASEQRIVNFLLSRLEQAPINTTIIVHFIHALGNTGSYYALDPIVSYLNHSVLRVQLVSISAMRKLTNYPLVKDMLQSMLQATPISMVHVVAIAETLIEGYRYLDEKELDYTPSLSLQMALVAATLQLGDVELADLALTYVGNFNNRTSEKLAHVLEQAIAEGKESSVQTRGRRGTDWDSSNSDYNVVDSHSSRQDDVRNFPSHRAYIWGKKIGIDEANLKVGAGVFMGINPSRISFKAFGKAAAKVKLLSWSWSLAKGEVLLEKLDNRLRTKMYFSILNNVLTDLYYDTTFSSSLPTSYQYRPSPTVYATRRYSIPRVSVPIFIYIATLSFYLQPHIEARIESRREFDINGGELSALAAIGPRITFIAEGGISADLLSLARGGVSVDIIFEYMLEVKGEGHLCATLGQSFDVDTQGCVGAYQGWPSTRIELYAWYQLRKVKFCDGWLWSLKFQYPCGIEWANRHRWDDFSITVNLGSEPLREIYGTCSHLRDVSCS